MSETVTVTSGGVEYRKIDGRWQWGAGYYVVPNHCDTLDALAAARQQLADVAYLAEWIQRGNDPLLPQHYVAGLVGQRFGAFAGLDLAEVSADSLDALGALLRQREVGR